MTSCLSLEGLSNNLTPLYSSEPSQQSQTPSFTRELGITDGKEYEDFEQKNFCAGHAEVEGSSDPS